MDRRSAHRPHFHGPGLLDSHAGLFHDLGPFARFFDDERRIFLRRTVPWLEAELRKGPGDIIRSQGFIDGAIERQNDFGRSSAWRK